MRAFAAGRLFPSLRPLAPLLRPMICSAQLPDGYHQQERSARLFINTP